MAEEGAFSTSSINVRLFYFSDDYQLFYVIWCHDPSQMILKLVEIPLFALIPAAI